MARLRITFVGFVLTGVSLAACCALAAPPDRAVSAPDTAAARSKTVASKTVASKTVASDAAAFDDEPARLVRSGLRFEVEGDAPYRNVVLGVAANRYPDFAPAQWQTGHVRRGEKWLKLADAEAAASADERLAEYARRRQKWLHPPTAEGHLKLARWCQHSDLAGRARYHFCQVFCCSPSAAQREQAAKQLALPTQTVERQLADVQRAQQGWQRWTPALQRIAKGMLHNDENVRRAAFDELSQITDPAAVPVLEATISRMGDTASLAVVELLGKMPQHAATMSLARHAVYSPSHHVRAAATAQLEKRPLHDYAPWLLSCLVSPVKSRFCVDELPNGTFVYMHDFYREGVNYAHIHRTNVTVRAVIDRVVYERLWRGFGDPNPAHGKLVYSGLVDGVDSPVTSDSAVAAELAGNVAENQAMVQVHNAKALHINKRIDAVLGQTTGQLMNADPVRWWKWWQLYNELQMPDQKPLIATYSNTRLQYTSGYSVQSTEKFIPSCFPAGTKVWTETGPAPIETIHAGDLVLSQDVDTGELAYKPVLATTIRPPTPIVRIRAGDGELRATRGHPFWVSGEGWKMAKFLAVGDKLHCPTGFLPIESVEAAAPEAAYNLIVDDFATYFVGDQRLLVHDNTLRRPTLSIVPGLKKD